MDNRSDLTAKILKNKFQIGVTWKKLGETLKKDEVYLAAAVFGQMPLDSVTATELASALSLNSTDIVLLQEKPLRGINPSSMPQDPMIYSIYQAFVLYGAAIKEVMGERFGDGVMSSTNFRLDLEKEPDPKGDRVKIILEGRFEPFKRF